MELVRLVVLVPLKELNAHLSNSDIHPLLGAARPQHLLNRVVDLPFWDLRQPVRERVNLPDRVHLFR